MDQSSLDIVNLGGNKSGGKDYGNATEGILLCFGEIQGLEQKEVALSVAVNLAYWKLGSAYYIFAHVSIIKQKIISVGSETRHL